ncbi:hypothetical protein STRTUCAR8_03487, partial [Streptomyces turgidiscabies Car8]
MAMSTTAAVWRVPRAGFLRSGSRTAARALPA